MTRRSLAREVALQLLYQYDLNTSVPRSALEGFARERLRNSGDLVAFCFILYDGVVAHKTDIDRRLTAVAENWRLARMAIVDRNVLRLGAYELLHLPETPPKVAFDEAIELARRFGAKDSPAFVNGLLDRIYQLTQAACKTEAAATAHQPPAADAPIADAPTDAWGDGVD